MLFFSHVPILWARHPEANVKFPAQSASYNFSGSHAPLAELFARHGRVLAQYSGHLHVHGHDQLAQRMWSPPAVCATTLASTGW